MKTIVALLHGILNSHVKTEWIDKGDAYLSKHEPNWKVLSHEYPSAWYNTLPLAGRLYTIYWKNNQIAKGLVNEILQFMDDGRKDIWLVGHSNGCNVARLAANRLMDMGYYVNGLILIGAACPSDCADLVDRERTGQLGKAIAYCSYGDEVLAKHPWIWPYGNLGHSGWMLDGKAYESRGIYDLWFYNPGTNNGVGHSGYFEPENFTRIMDQIRKDINL